jgi:hypothetical protein
MERGRLARASPSQCYIGAHGREFLDYDAMVENPKRGRRRGRGRPRHTSFGSANFGDSHLKLKLPLRLRIIHAAEEHGLSQDRDRAGVDMELPNDRTSTPTAGIMHLTLLWRREVADVRPRDQADLALQILETAPDVRTDIEILPITPAGLDGDARADLQFIAALGLDDHRILPRIDSLPVLHLVHREVKPVS